MEKKIIITIGRQYGSGGRYVGKKLAEQLGIAFYDKELINLASKESGICGEFFEKADERNSGSLLKALAMGFSMNNAIFQSNDYLSNESLFQIQSDVIRKVAAEQSCILVGRCADYILRDNENCISVFISARMEDRILLTVNTLLLQIFTLFSYMNDGFAYAAEALTGRFIGARDEQSLRRCLGRCLGWGTLISVLFVGIYLIWWRDLLGIFIKAGTPDAAQVVSTAGNYIVWIILIPLASAMPFIMDGIMVGATETKVMRNSMLLSTVAYFGIFYSLYPVIGNNALWLAFTLYMFLRGTLQLLMTRRLRLIYRKAAA